MLYSEVHIHAVRSLDLRIENIRNQNSIPCTGNATRILVERGILQPEAEKLRSASSPWQ